MSLKRSFMPVMICLAVLACQTRAVDAKKNSSILTAKPKKGSTPVEFFQAISDDQIEAKFIPKNAEGATVIVKNKTDKPLSIQMPAAFAGLPVLAQIGGAGGGGGGLGGGGGGGGGGGQAMGGGMGGGMGGMGGGMFNVGPERVGKLKVATVCLEHGKDDPNPRMAYEMKPITDFTQDQQLIEVVKMLGRGQLDQSVAQAAAWHLSDDLSWNQLVNKVKVRHLNGSVKMFFTPQQVQNAMQAVQIANNMIARRKSDESHQPSVGELKDYEAKSADEFIK